MALAAGFAFPVAQSQSCFRAVMEATSRPGLVRALAAGVLPPAPLTPELAAIALAFADPDAPLWLDRALARVADVRDFLRFHTGARIVERPDEAAFALIVEPASMPALADFAQGTDAYPDRSTTVVVAVDALEGDGSLVVTGPGVNGEARLSISPQPDDVIAQLRENHARFPRGVDLLFVAAGRIAALPRSADVVEAC